MKLSLLVKSSGENSQQHAICHSFNESRFIEENFDALMAITELHKLPYLTKCKDLKDKPGESDTLVTSSHLAAATNLVAWLRANVSMWRPSSFTLTIRTESMTTAVKWFWEHSRHFKHIPPRNCLIFENTISQQYDFSWVSLIMGSNSRANFLPASNLFVVGNKQMPASEQFPYGIPYEDYIIYHGELSGERCYPNWVTDEVLAAITDKIENPTSRGSITKMGQPASNGYKNACSVMDNAYIEHLVHVEYTNFGPKVTDIQISQLLAKVYNNGTM